MKKNKLKLLTALILLVLIMVVKAASVYIGQFFSDAVINLLLIMSAMLLTTTQCVVVAALSPFLQKALGLTVFPVAITSVIGISNILFITVYTVAFQIFASRTPWQKYFTWGISILLSSLLKFEMQFLVIQKFLLKFLEINADITYNFGGTQFLSALLAGVAAMLVVYPVKKKIFK